MAQTLAQLPSLQSLVSSSNERTRASGAPIHDSDGHDFVTLLDKAIAANDRGRMDDAAPDREPMPFDALAYAQGINLPTRIETPPPPVDAGDVAGASAEPSMRGPAGAPAPAAPEGPARGIGTTESDTGGAPTSGSNARSQSTTGTAQSAAADADPDATPSVPSADELAAEIAPPRSGNAPAQTITQPAALAAHAPGVSTAAMQAATTPASPASPIATAEAPASPTGGATAASATAPQAPGPTATWTAQPPAGDPNLAPATATPDAATDPMAAAPRAAAPGQVPPSITPGAPTQQAAALLAAESQPMRSAAAPMAGSTERLARGTARSTPADATATEPTSNAPVGSRTAPSFAVASAPTTGRESANADPASAALPPGVTLSVEPSATPARASVAPSASFVAQLTQDAGASMPTLGTAPAAVPVPSAPMPSPNGTTGVLPEDAALATVAGAEGVDTAMRTTDPSGREAPFATQAPGSAAQAPETAAARAQRVATHPAIAQVAVSVSKAVQEGVDRITIKLQPPELGRIDVRIDVGVDGRLQAVFAAERPATIEILQRDVRELERALQNAGLSTDAGSLSFGLKNQGGGRQSPFAGNGNRGGAGSAADHDVASDSPVARHAQRRRADGHLDIHV